MIEDRKKFRGFIPGSGFRYVSAWRDTDGAVTVEMLDVVGWVILEEENGDIDFEMVTPDGGALYLENPDQAFAIVGPRDPEKYQNVDYWKDAGKSHSNMLEKSRLARAEKWRREHPPKEVAHG